MNVLDVVDAASLRKDIPSFRSGDELKVHVRVIEGTKSRIQVFQGVVIARSGSGIRESFTIRKISYGVGVERTFPVHTPVIEKIEIVGNMKIQGDIYPEYDITFDIGKDTNKLRNVYNSNLYSSNIS